ncbi:MAG: type II toxin-antitoxin system VapC family toxin [Candidatus Omnitrophica bacterium]|nr:type II toxin-antitoxin system VapC family toxin [Candidatus Omnitrophota bacterium]
MAADRQACVLDTSAILAYVQDEPGSARVGALLKEALNEHRKIFISFATMSEVYYIVCQKNGLAAARKLVVLLKELPVTIVHSNERITLAAGRIKATCRLSFADAFIAATALETKALLVHKDPEFEPLATSITLEALPYKSRSIN